MSPVKTTLLLSYFSVIYNIIEGLVCLWVGSATGTISLIGFGLDSFIESLSAGVLIWRFRESDIIKQSHHDPIEAKAIKLISYTFFVLGSYVLFESLRKLYFHEYPEQNLVGMAVALVSIIIMLILYQKKTEVGRENHIRSLVADSKQTLACIWMSVTLLISIGVYNLLGIWWMDAVGGLVISGLLFREGFNTYKEKRLCTCV